MRYDPWGKRRYSPVRHPTGYRYTSQRWDSGLGLYDYNARYYDPALGKFISADTLVPDPAAPQQYNRYTYSLNSPLVFVDPSGHCTQYAGVNDAELSACLEAWNSLGNSYLELVATWGMESYPNELMNESAPKWDNRRDSNIT
ncbi:MAG: RHS repeat-associated core domain-containing protein [Chloroflexi bacterium]|nr:RHS repeat-associated core domain-containing protein [Chloroflexota bacterium]